jgi:ribonuclease HI
VPEGIAYHVVCVGVPLHSQLLHSAGWDCYESYMKYRSSRCTSSQVIMMRPELLAVRFSSSKPKWQLHSPCVVCGACQPNPCGHAGAVRDPTSRSGNTLEGRLRGPLRPPDTRDRRVCRCLLIVLRFLLAEGIQWATVYGDSRMVIQQINGEIKVRPGVYLAHYREACDLMARLPDVRLVWISGGQNMEADRLSKEGLTSGLPGRSE